MSAPLRRLAASALLALAVLPGTARYSTAAVIRWIDPLGGNASNSSNWSPAQVPTAVDEARFDTTGTYDVTWSAATDSTGSMRFRAGDVTLLFTALHNVATQLAVGQNTNETATARIEDGTLRAGWSMLVGTGNGSDGTLVVDGAASELLQNIGPGTPLMSVGGSSGTGLVRVAQGGRIVLADRLNLGIGSGGQATLRVRGEGTGSGARRSQLLADGPTADARIGGNDSHGTLEVLEGGLARFARTVTAGEEPGDSAEVIVGGRGTNDSSRFVIVGDLFASANRRTVGGGGWSRITLDSLGVIEVGDTTEVGDVDGSDGRLTLARGSRLLTRHLVLRQPTGQVIDLQGGLLQIRGGSLSTAGDRLVVPGASGAPTIELLDGAHADFVGTSSDPPIELGTTDDVTLHVTGGAALTATGGPASLATGAASAASLLVTQGASFTSDRRLIAGADGRAVVRVTDSAQMFVDGVDVGTAGTQTSLVSVMDQGQLVSSGLLNVGGTALSGSGYGQVSVADGGTIALTRAGLCGTVWPGGHLFAVETGQLDLASSFIVRGELGVFDGTITGGPLLLRGSGIMHGYGDVPASISAGADSSVVIVAEGPLALGSAGNAAGFLMRGTLDVGAHNVTLRDADSAMVGVALIDGGQLFLPEGGGVIESGKRLVGRGTVHGDLTNRGHVIGSGAELRFAGMLIGSGAGVSADTMRFLAGGGFEGMGVLDGRVRCDSGSVIRATGDLTIGRITPAPLSDALLLRGRIETGPHQVVLASSWNPSIRGTIVLGGGVLSTVNTGLITAPSGSRLEGRGRITNQWSGNTTHSPGPGAGRLRFDGPLGLGFQSRYEVDLGDHATGEHDTIVVAGAFSISGGCVLDVRRLPSFAALPGDSFRVIEHASRTGTFASVTLDGTPATGALEVHHNADGVWLVLLPGILGVGGGPGSTSPVAALRFASFGSPGRQVGVELALPEAARVQIDVFDVHGRRLASLHHGSLAAGRHRFDVPKGLGSAGVLFARATLGEGTTHRVRTVRLVRLD